MIEDAGVSRAKLESYRASEAEIERLAKDAEDDGAGDDPTEE